MDTQHPLGKCVVCVHVFVCAYMCKYMGVSVCIHATYSINYTEHFICFSLQI